MRRPAGIPFACSFLPRAALSWRLDRDGRAGLELDRALGPARAAFGSVQLAAALLLPLVRSALMGWAVPMLRHALASGAARTRR